MGRGQQKELYRTVWVRVRVKVRDRRRDGEIRPASQGCGHKEVPGGLELPNPHFSLVPALFNLQGCPTPKAGPSDHAQQSHSCSWVCVLGVVLHGRFEASSFHVSITPTCPREATEKRYLSLLESYDFKEDSSFDLNVRQYSRVIMLCDPTQI